MIFEGSAVALCTPFTQTGINFDVLKQLLEFQIDNKTDAILILGTTGEPATMTEEEKEAILSCTMQTVAGRAPVIVGVGGNHTAKAAQFAKKAADYGAQAILALTPYYNKCSEEGLIAHFTQIADAGKLPMIVYNVPSRTGVNMSSHQFSLLLEHPYIDAIKEASGNIAQVADMAAAARGRGQIYSGNDDQILPVLSLGGSGVISVLANIAPAYTHDMVHAFLNGDVQRATKMQLDVLPLIHALFSEVNPIPAKTALQLCGFDMGPFRLPLCPLSDKKTNVLRKEMEEFGLTTDRQKA